MKSTLAVKTVAILATALSADALSAQGSAPWPDYRGPGQQGHAPESSRPPLRWSETKNIRWKTAIPGASWSSPIVCDGKVWLTNASADGSKHFVLGVDFETGKLIHEVELWTNEEVQPKHKLNSHASPSAVAEAGRVYVHFGTYGTACLDSEKAELLWKRRDLNCNHIVGPGSSPILWGDRLIFHVDGGDVQYVVALDKKSGKTLWKTERSVDLSKQIPDMRKAYSTPIAIQVDGKPQLISSGAQASYAYDPLSGKELWRVRHKGFSMSSRPLHDGEHAYLNTGFMKARLLAVRTDGEGDVSRSHLAWTYRRGVPTIPSPILIDGRLYLVSDTGILTCVDAKRGKRLWYERLDGAYSASLLHAGRHLYLFDREGRGHVLEPGAEYREVAVNELAGGCMASPAVVGDALVVRTKTHLYRIEEKAATSTPTGKGR